MVRLTVDLIRKKSEHHGGLLSELEEISLHQLNIERIETIGSTAPRLKILYLQNNIIPKIENLHRLKDLQYLNLALNNIITINNGLSSCEKLNKLDLTVNFIDIDQLQYSINNLKELINLRELYLTGNPCTQWKYYRFYVIAELPALTKLDGIDINRTEQLESIQLLSEIKKELIREEKQKLKEKAANNSNTATAGPIDPNIAQAYTPESRLAAHLESEAAENRKLTEQKQRDKEFHSDTWQDAKDKLNQKVILDDDNDNSIIPSQRNTGRYEFELVDNNTTTDINNNIIYNTVLTVYIAKYLDSSLIDIDIHPLWIQIIIKGKNLLLHFPAEILVNTAKIQRIQSNGALIVTVKKLNQNQQNTVKSINTIDNIESKQSNNDDIIDTINSIKSTINVSNVSNNNNRNAININSNNTDSTTYRNIVKKSNNNNTTPELIEISSQRSANLTIESAQAERKANKAKSNNNTSTSASAAAKLAELGLTDSDIPDLE